MIKNSFKNFFKNLVYIFVPMGIFYFGALLTIFYFSRNFLINVTDAGNELITYINANASTSEIAIKDFIDYAINQINWNNNIYEVIKEIINKNWINNTINGFLNTLNVSSSGLTAEINSIINVFSLSVKNALYLSICSLGIFIFLSTILTRYILSKETINQTFKEKILGYIIKPIVSLIMITLILFINSLIGGYALIILLIYLILDAYFSLFTSWFIYKNKGLKLKEVMNIKNTSKSLLSTFLIIGFTILIALIFAYINLNVGILITIPLVIYSLNIISINSESYVKNLVNKKGN